MGCISVLTIQRQTNRCMFAPFLIKSIPSFWAYYPEDMAVRKVG